MTLLSPEITEELKELPIVKVDGKYIDVKLEHVLNTPLPRVSEQDGLLKNTLVKLLQLAKAPSPRLIDEESIDTLVIADPLNAFFSMDVTDEGMVIPLLPFSVPAL